MENTQIKDCMTSQIAKINTSTTMLKKKEKKRHTMHKPCNIYLIRIRMMFRRNNMSGCRGGLSSGGIFYNFTMWRNGCGLRAWHFEVLSLWSGAHLGEIATNGNANSLYAPLEWERDRSRSLCYTTVKCDTDYTSTGNNNIYRDDWSWKSTAMNKKNN